MLVIIIRTPGLCLGVYPHLFSAATAAAAAQDFLRLLQRSKEGGKLFLRARLPILELLRQWCRADFRPRLRVLRAVQPRHMAGSHGQLPVPHDRDGPDPGEDEENPELVPPTQDLARTQTEEEIAR